jgi:glutaredoxin 2
MSSYALYYYDACPYCQRVLGALPKVKVAVEKRNTMSNADYRKELIQGGGRSTVPCLRIEENGQVRWMYESMDIIQHLQKL